ncbi:hypothetical protein MHTCC0001_18720 [Flavobacteriaceae bacterium MHTCC 0001]
MKKYILLVSISSLVLGLYAQEEDPCAETLKEAKAILYKTSPFVDQTTLIPLLEPCATEGNAQAENYLGLAYLQGIGTEKDEDKAFKYIFSAAQKDYATAQYNLGRLYKHGLGCELNFTNAITWWETAISNGSQRAAFTLGYMYYKGFGVAQDYKRAVYWFERSDYPMARHFLAICNYFGYGVPVNESRALELLLANPTINSKTLLTYIKAERKIKNEAAVNKVLQTHASTKDSTYIAPNVISSVEIDEYTGTIITDDINGEWVGKLVEYDWSGEHIMRILPLTLNFNTGNSAHINIQATIAGQELKGTGQFQDGSIYVDSDMTFTLDKLYSGNPNELSLDHTLFTLGLEKKTWADNTYLTGFVDTFRASWKEYGKPMSMVLRPKTEAKEEEIDLELLEALAAQEDQFIKLYPVPFNEQLTIQYQLENTDNVYVELISLNGTNKIVILPTTQQQAGDYTYTIPLDVGLPVGLYVVRLIAGGQLYTRMIAKDN